jgi:hypothetical protein
MFIKESSKFLSFYVAHKVHIKWKTKVFGLFGQLLELMGQIKINKFY